MKLILSRESLLKPLQMVMGVVDRKQTLPILSNVLLNINQKLSVVGTDLEIELTAHSTGSDTLSTPFQMTLPGRKLLDICRALPENATIELYQDRQQVVLRSHRSRFTLSTLPAEDYPNTEPQSVNLKIELNEQELLKLLQRTHFAMAQQDVRYYLNGMLFEFIPGKLRTVATDGHRLATDTIPADVQEHHRIQVIVPRKGVMELMRLINSSDGALTVSVGTSYIEVNSDQYTFISKLIEGRFPDYQRVIPKNPDRKITINREEFKQALIRTAILSNDKVRGVFLELKPNLLRLLSNNPEQELAEEELSVSYSGPDFGLAFNVNYLLDVLNILNSEDIELHFSSAHNNSLLIADPNGPLDQAFVVMPMRM
ncbi:MAG: DNA polymerase III subunit beta [Proteobacteria bacterium]|nr:DNA polymerase III subunit beta [Pseudomonadota bacterium]